MAFVILYFAVLFGSYKKARMYNKGLLFKKKLLGIYAKACTNVLITSEKS